MRRPSSAGLPAERYPEWRRGQDRALKDLLFSRSRFNLLCIPTGGGKTVIYMGHGGVDEGRQAVLTATRQLQDQVGDEFGESMGLFDMRGRDNYICDIDETRTAARAKCTAGVFCERMKGGGCRYYDAKKVAGQERLVITNYRYWLHDEESESLGQFETLVLDEAHTAPDQISEYAAVEVTAGELRTFGLPLPPPDTRKRPADWANQALTLVEDRAEHQADLDRRRLAINLKRKLARLCKLSDSEWVGSRPSSNTWRWDLVDPGSLAEELLFRGAKRVILVSASVRRKTLKLLGVGDKAKVIEQASIFPVRRRPIYYWPVAAVSGRKMTDSQRREWYEGMAHVISKRMDRKGLCASHSYKWGEQIYDNLPKDQRRMMILHEQGQPADEVLARFRASKPPRLLVSPAFSTGTDLPYDDCEYLLVPKVPFPDMSSPLVKIRMSRDKDYVPYVTMQSLVQTVGRGMRAADDQLESFIFDYNFGWMRYRHWDFAPQYFHQAIRTVDVRAVPPDPPPPLALTRGRQR